MQRLAFQAFNHKHISEYSIVTNYCKHVQFDSFAARGRLVRNLRHDGTWRDAKHLMNTDASFIYTFFFL